MRMVKRVTLLCCAALLAPACAATCAEIAEGVRPASVRVLADFETEAEMRGWGVGKIAAELSSDHPTHGKSGLKVVVPANETATFARWARQDWSGWQQLALDVFNTQDEPVNIVVEVWDVPGKGAHSKRYRGPFTLREGPNTVAFELAELRVNDRSRNIELSQVQQVLISATGVAKETVLHFDDFRLTGRFKGAPPKLLFAWNRYPGLFFYYRERPAHSIEMTVTYDRVTEPAALRLNFPDTAGSPGAVFKELDRNEGKDFSNYQGLSVWVKGDGSTGQGQVYLGHASGPAAFFPLSDRQWHRVDIRWSDFDGRVDPGNISVLAFGLKNGSPRPAHYIIDRPQFVPDFADLDEETDLARRANTARRELDPRVPEPASLVARGKTLPLRSHTSPVQGGHQRIDEQVRQGLWRGAQSGHC